MHNLFPAPLRDVRLKLATVGTNNGASVVLLPPPQSGALSVDPCAIVSVLLVFILSFFLQLRQGLAM